MKRYRLWNILNISVLSAIEFAKQVDAPFETIRYCGFEWWNNCTVLIPQMVLNGRSANNNNNNNNDKICSAHISTCWLLKAQIQKHRGKPLLFHDKCTGFFYVHYTTYGTYSFTSHPKDKAITVKCLAQGHKHRDQPGRDSNPHSGNTRTWVQCTRPLGHNTQYKTLFASFQLVVQLIQNLV